jgi:23S rRNA (uracil1939-C5)-methyltransferase
VIDAYSGVGILSSLLAKKARKVIGIEHSEEAVEDALENATRNAVQDRCEFIQGPVEQILGSLLSRKGKKNEEKPSVVILNPPRNGVKEAVIESLSEGLPPKIIYVSCNPYSLARDLSFLMSRANYSLQLSLFDMFPHTMHVELVASLTLKDK